jgi:two-component system, NarL family, response regulator LiaR
MVDEKTVKVLIVDDHALVRSGLKNFIFAYEWMEVAGEAANGAAAVEFCTHNDVDIVLMDVVMPEMDGCEATRRIMALGKPVKIIILTNYYEQENVERALNAGATSYLLKNVTPEQLSQAIQAALTGRPTLAPEATQVLIQATRQKPSSSFNLTTREQEVLALLVKGLSNQEIADQLSISITTAKYHLSNIFDKLGATSRVEAATIALDHKLVNKG